MKHTPIEIMNISREMAHKIIKLHEMCDEEEELRCHELAKVAAMARLVTGDLDDYDPKEDADGLGSC